MLFEGFRDEELPWEKGRNGPCMKRKLEAADPELSAQANDRGMAANRAAKCSARLLFGVLAVSPEHDP